MSLVDPQGRPLVRNVVFDVNGVLTASPLDAIYRVERQHDLPRGTILEILIGDYDKDSAHPWHRVERGEISFQRYIAHVAVDLLPRRLGVSPLALRQAMHDPDAKRVDEEMIDVLFQLNEHDINLALLTNGLRRYEARWRSVLPMHLFDDRVIDSSRVGHRKPSDRIFKLAHDQWGFEPTATAFVDDYSSNTLAASQTVGWRGIHHTDTQSTIAQVAELTGLDLTLPIQRWAPPAAQVAPAPSYRKRVRAARERVEELIAWHPQTPIDPPLQPRGKAMRNSAPRAGLDRVVTGVRITQQRTTSAVKETLDDAVSAGTRALAAGLDRLHEAFQRHRDESGVYGPGMGWQPLQLNVDDSPTVND